MKCPRCGNDIQMQESFCGQCGLPVRPATTGSMPRQPMSSHSGISSAAFTSNHIQAVPRSNTTHNQSGSMPRIPHADQSGVQYYPGYPGNPSQTQYSGQSGAMPQVPPTSQRGIRSNPGYGAGLSQTDHFQSYSNNGLPALTRPPATPGQQSGLQPSLVDIVNMHAQARNTQTDHPYAAHTQFSRSAASRPPIAQPEQPVKGRVKPRKSISTGSSILVVCICLLIILIGVVGGSIFLTNHSNASQTTANGHVNHDTKGSSVASPTAASATTPPSLPTPVPDAGFVACGTQCAPMSFMDEYPLGWQRMVMQAGGSVQFINPMQQDELAMYKVQANPTVAADVLLGSELQTIYASQPGYQPATATHQMTIGGENWIAEDIVYQGSNRQVEHVATYATVHHNKSYIIEFQAPQNQFAQTTAAYFNAMLGKFQFA